MKKLIALSLTAGLLSLSFFSCKFVNENTNTNNNESTKVDEGLSSRVYSKYSSATSAEWGCHDPRLFQDEDGTYYVYSTGWSAGVQTRVSKDLISWTKKSASPFYTSSSTGSSQYPHMYWDDDFLAWQGYLTNDGSDKSSSSTYTVSSEPNSWAPAIIKQNGLYYMFHGIVTDSETYNGVNRRAGTISMSISESPTGPFIPASTYDSETYSNSTLVHSVFNNTDASLIENDTPGYSNCNNTSNGSWNKGFGCIDPEFVIDVATGKLMEYTIGSNTCYAMTYGSWLGGIALIYVDAETLKPVCTVAGTATYDGKTYAVGDEMDCPVDGISGNQGTLIAGGSGAAYEGAQLIYNSDTGYYYIFVSMGNLTYEYRVGVGRSSTIDGTYLDAGGVSLKSTTSSNYHAIGSKIIGAFAFDGEYGFRCQGGQSIFRDKSGKILFANHARTNYLGTGNFVLQIHQMFFNEDGWPVLNQNDYYDEDAELESLSLSDIAGTYDFVHTVRGTETAVFNSTDGVTEDDYNVVDANDTPSQKIVIDSEGNIKGYYTGSVSLGEKGSITIELKSAEGLALGTFKGFVMNAVDWYRKGTSTARKTITLTALDSTSGDSSAGEYVFANRTSTSTEISTDISYSDYQVPAISSINTDTGVSVSFNLSEGYASDWDAVIASTQATINLATMEYWPSGVWSANIFEASATAGSAAASDAWKTYYTDASYVSISFNADGSIVFYKDGVVALTYQADTAIGSSTNTVSQLCYAFINDVSTSGFTFIPSAKIETGGFTVSNLKVGSALDADSAKDLFDEQ